MEMYNSGQSHKFCNNYLYHKGKDAQTLLQISKFHTDYHICVLVSSCLFTMTEIEVRNDQQTVVTYPYHINSYISSSDYTIKHYCIIHIITGEHGQLVF